MTNNPWVKATDRKPDHSDLVHINYKMGTHNNATNLKTTGFLSGAQWYHVGSDPIPFSQTIEWLDEQALSSLVEDNAEKTALLERCQILMQQFIHRTPTGEYRNLLCDFNTELLQALKPHQ